MYALVTVLLGATAIYNGPIEPVSDAQWDQAMLLVEQADPSINTDFVARVSCTKKHKQVGEECAEGEENCVGPVSTEGFDCVVYEYKKLNATEYLTIYQNVVSKVTFDEFGLANVLVRKRVAFLHGAFKAAIDAVGLQYWEFPLGTLRSFSLWEQTGDGKLGDATREWTVTPDEGFACMQSGECSDIR